MVNNNKFKILVVDDETEILEIVSEEFEEVGLITSTAKSSQEAISKIRENDFDAVVSDYKMEGGTGFEILDHLEKMDGQVPLFFFMSGFFRLKDGETVRMGVEKLYSKPFSVKELVSDVKDVLEMKQMV
jgi:CheY-like chemotaxis protein